MRDFGYDLIVYDGRTPKGSETPLSRLPDGRRVLMEAHVAPDEGGRTDREHWFVQVCSLMLCALRARGVGEQRERWTVLLHEVEAIVEKLVQEEKEQQQ